MIYDTLGNITLYKGLSPAMDAAIDAILQTDFEELAPGRYEVDGDTVYYMVQTPALKERADTKWEIHRRYIDIQIGLRNGEAIGYMPADAVSEWEPYNGEKDAAISWDAIPGVLLPLSAGTFAIFFPNDAHRPVEKVGDAVEGFKVVFKVLVD